LTTGISWFVTSTSTSMATSSITHGKNSSQQCLCHHLHPQHSRYDCAGGGEGERGEEAPEGDVVTALVVRLVHERCSWWWHRV
jgi:hypothetical protein